MNTKNTKKKKRGKEIFGFSPKIPLPPFQSSVIKETWPQYNPNSYVALSSGIKQHPESYIQNCTWYRRKRLHFLHLYKGRSVYYEQ